MIAPRMGSFEDDTAVTPAGEGWRPGDWVLGRYFTRTVGDGLLEEDAELFDTDGRLLVQSRQLALAR